MPHILYFLAEKLHFVKIDNIIVGWVYDVTDYYSASFYLGGTVCVLASIVLLPITIRTNAWNVQGSPVDGDE